MSKKRFVFISLSILILLVLIFGMNLSFSAYSSCRSLAMKTKGYSAWKYESTTENGSQAQVSFSDTYNNPLTCNATRIGPFWLTTSYSRIHAHCTQKLTIYTEPSDPCPEDYFGVEP